MKHEDPTVAAEMDGQRRSQRMLLVIPVTVSWRTTAGVTLRQHAATEIVNAHGALLKIKACIPVNTVVDMMRPSLNRSAKARVVCSGAPNEEGVTHTAVEFVERNDEFWGISFPPADRPVLWHTA
jgi:hypothetical protein